MKSIRDRGLKDEKGVLLTTLPFNRRVDGTALKLAWDKPPAKRQKTSKSPCTTCHEHDLLTLARYGDERQRHTVSALLCHNTDTMHVNILFDTGALQSNYLSEDVAGWMRQRGVVAQADSSRVCGAFEQCSLTKFLFNCRPGFSSLVAPSLAVEFSSRKSTQARRKRDAGSTSANSGTVSLDTSTAKRRKLSKLSALAAFMQLERVTSETPEGTSRTKVLDKVQGPGQHRGTSETPEGTSCNLSALMSAKTDVVYVELDARELDIPYDMIIGRPSICEHKLLQFDPELIAGLETPITRHPVPLLKSTEPPVAPATHREAGPAGNTLRNPADRTTDRAASTDYALELLWVISEREHWRTESRYSAPAEAVTSSRPTGDTSTNVPTAELHTMREPKNDTLGMPADQLYNSSAVGSVPVLGIPDTKGFVASQRWHQTKLDGSELNRAHVSDMIHYEATAEGLEWIGHDDPVYVGERGPPVVPKGSRPQGVGEIHSGEQVDEPTPVYCGPPSLRERCRLLCEKYDKIISTHLNPEPANLPPMELKVEEERWRVSSNQGPARQQTAAKNIEVRKQIDKLLPIGVIKPSQAEHYSQVHLTPKPHTPQEWRFCIDYRWLNLVCKGMGWPIPNIKNMLQRLGAKRAKYYAKLDLTSGYHQAPLHKDSRGYTAFVTFMGIYEWCRVPMGLKGAPSYFQGVLASIVLVGLLYFICELYIDDIIVYGRDEDEFLANLERVFQRLEKHQLTCNPKKMFLGLEEVEFVGHTVNHSGITFSREKIEKVLAIKEPVYGKELKAFLGVVGYFHSHIRDYAIVARPLHKMIHAYERNRKLVWTDEGCVQTTINCK